MLVTVGRRTLKMRKQEKERAAGKSASGKDGRSSPSFLKRLLGRTLRSHKQSKQTQATGGSSTGASTPSETLDPDIEKLGPAQHTAGKALEEELARRLARFSPTNRGLHGKQAQDIGNNDGDHEHEMGDTVWEALEELPRELLDPFQPATRLSALFRGQTVPPSTISSPSSTCSRRWSQRCDRDLPPATSQPRQHS